MIELQKEGAKTFTEAYKLSRGETTQLNKKYRDFIKICFPSLQIVNVLAQGDSFGEIALITNCKRYPPRIGSLYDRTATLVCSQDTHLMTLHKKEFQSILERYRY